MSSPPSNPYRDPPLRYLGYANELGEASKPLLGPGPLRHLYPLSYLVALSYVALDGYECARLAPDRKAAAAADAVLWQTAASVVVPGFVINRIVGATNRAVEGGGAPKWARRKWAGSLAGVAAIPFIIKPIDFLVDEVMDFTVRRIYK